MKGGTRNFVMSVPLTQPTKQPTRMPTRMTARTDEVQHAPAGQGRAR